MTLSTHLSAATARTSAPSISSLMKLALERPEIVSLAAGFVDQQSLPIATTAHAAAQILGDEPAGRSALQYGTTIGDEALRAILVERLEVQHGVPPGTYRQAVGRTVLTTGSAQLIYLVGEALLDPGDIVIVESPTYFVFLGPLETRGARAIRTPIDEHGLQIDALEATLGRLRDEGLLEKVKLIYTIPEHANPTGISLADDRRKPLVDLVRRWSEKAGRRIYLLEDSAYHGLSYDHKEGRSLWSLDPEGETVILARTFSKTFSPGMKLGYGVLPKALVDPILALKGNHDFGTSNFVQKLVRLVLAGGEYDRHVEHLRALYARKCDVFVEALERYFAPIRDRVSWTRPNGGLYVWMTLPEEVDAGFDGPLFARCLAEGVIYVPGEFAFAPEPTAAPRHHLRLSFGVPDEATLAEGARRLAEAVRATLRPAPDE
ncbi:PLP-dependent aminotransferase family protein [Paludisphaera mucosa]|uniref:PLP-dependent aminotransferase family protein n=1 Tax=Paludisphaera mucosa TaxID=3030827 RepID=A0ABT6F5C4_9BACT|nr:PLP-dependent aminotransferase family protein [Paludisphaera mucosa]MDG3002782.1 PLP-dependent aminotransferase family protein [Paludisphaera mucosa]